MLEVLEQDSVQRGPSQKAETYNNIGMINCATDFSSVRNNVELNIYIIVIMVLQKKVQG